MPNNGVISKQAVIPSSFIVESAEGTDLVIINTPLSGSKVEQKAVPVSALGGGPATLPFNSFVYAFKLSGLISESYEVYNDVPTEYGSWSVNIFPGATVLDTVSITIEFIPTEGTPVDLEQSFLSVDSCIVNQSDNFIKTRYAISFSVTDGIALQTTSLVELRMYNLNP